MHSLYTVGPVLTVARGTTAKPSFEQVQVPVAAEAGAKPATITLAAATGGVLLPSTAPGAGAEGAVDGKARVKPTREDVTMLGADNMGAPVLMRTAAVAAGGKKRGPQEEGEAEEAQVEEGECCLSEAFIHDAGACAVPCSHVCLLQKIEC